jgi:hypothetical protein
MKILLIESNLILASRVKNSLSGYDVRVGKDWQGEDVVFVNVEANPPEIIKRAKGKGSQKGHSLLRAQKHRANKESSGAWGGFGGAQQQSGGRKKPAMGKHRRGKVKLEHHLLEGLEEYLKKLSGFSSVKSIIPGRIVRQNKGIGSKGLFLKYETPTGYKLLYKNGTSVQEIFVVCEREKFLEEFKANFFNP